MQKSELLLRRLDELIEESRKGGEPWGYFVATYRQALLRLMDGVISTKFDDSVRMLRLVTALVERYLRTLRAYKAGGTIPQCWDLAFNACRKNKITVLQLIMLGMTAHVYLDLGIVAAEIMRQDRYALLKRDFSVLFDTLFAEIEHSKQRIGKRSMLMRLLGHRLGDLGEWLPLQARASFRETAWEFGQKLSELDPAFWAVAISDRDSLVSDLGWTLLSPNAPRDLWFWWMAKLERRGVANHIDALR